MAAPRKYVGELRDLAIRTSVDLQNDPAIKTVRGAQDRARRRVDELCGWKERQSTAPAKSPCSRSTPARGGGRGFDDGLGEGPMV